MKGKVDGQTALTFLAGLLTLLRQSGYAGVVVVLDEVETVQRMNAQTREKSLNALRQLMDMLASDELPGLYLVVTGTRDFFEGYKGLKGLQPLYQRVEVSFGEDPKWDNLRAPQVRLPPFTAERLIEVGRRVRSLYPTEFSERLGSRVGDEFLDALVRKVTEGFGGQVSVAPRLFLRDMVDVLDRVDQLPDFDPAAHYRFELREDRLTAEELAAHRQAEGTSAGESATEEGASNPAERPSRRLDG